MNTSVSGPETGVPMQIADMRSFSDTANPTGEVKSLSAGVPEHFSFAEQDQPDVVALIQTFDKSRDEDKNGASEDDTNGDQLALVDLRSAPLDAATGYKLFAGQQINPKVQYMLLGSNVDFANNKGFRGLSNGDSFTYGRFVGDEQAAKTDTKSRFDASPTTSRNHFSISIGESGEVAITDVGSSNGTRVSTGEKIRESASEVLSTAESLHNISRQQELGSVTLRNTLSVSLITEVPQASPNAWAPPVPRFESAKTSMPDYASARGVENDELVRVAGNEGKAVAEKYKMNQAKARALIVDQLANGQLYKDKDSFTRAIQEAHKLAASDNVYQEVGAGSMKLDESNAGQIRGEGTPTNKRISQSIKVAELAARYGDRYAARFNASTPNIKNMSQVELDRVDKKYWPKDYIATDDAGRPLKETYSFDYPDGESMDSYFTAMADIGNQIAAEINSPTPNKDRALQLIAEQYQYGAIARPFDQINNSLFMNLANAQIKALGFKGITHGEMDIAAQRMQVGTFEYYFINRVKGIEK